MRLSKIFKRLTAKKTPANVSGVPATKDEDLAKSIASLEGRVAFLEKQLLLAETYHTRAFWHALDVADEANLERRTIRCIICDHAGGRSSYEVLASTCQFNGGRLERYRCPVCDCVFGAEKFLRIDDALLDLDYQLLYSRYAEGNTTENEVRAFHSLNPQRDLLYLNWGAGAWNTTVQDLRGKGYNVWGLEPTAETSAECTVRSADELSQTIEGIFSNNVIEHFRDPVTQFRQFHSLLASGARMAHASPCYEYLYEYTRFHTVFLLGRSPEILANRTGFRLVDFTNDGAFKNCIFEKL